MIWCSLLNRLASLEEMHAVWEGMAAEMAGGMADGLVAQRIDYHGCRLRVSDWKSGIFLMLIRIPLPQFEPG